MTCITTQELTFNIFILFKFYILGVAVGVRGGGGAARDCHSSMEAQWLVARSVACRLLQDQPSHLANSLRKKKTPLFVFAD